MPRVIQAETSGAHLPIYTWGRWLPDGALRQLKHIAAQPYVVERVAAMPDLHVAHGVAVGTIFATSRAIVPSALGGDLGCGMRALRFEVPAATLSRHQLQHIVADLQRHIPVGDAIRRGLGLPVPHQPIAVVKG
jgi:tRNA-splicing ligase RtcB (3'-phosphate/5'-hydroxy nucleic acid ligase)